MKKDSLIITRETMLGHLLFILEKLNNIDKLLEFKIKNKTTENINNKSIGQDNKMS